MAVAKAGYFDLAQSDLSLFGRRGRKIVSFDRLLFSVSGNAEVQIDRQVADIAFGSPATVIWLRIQPKGHPPTIISCLSPMTAPMPSNRERDRGRLIA